jgi:hypothetical protein|tara:strand:+ start:1286 stop:1516 length:231 start_codon:yes stop_codon:yes gene_type:complete
MKFAHTYSIPSTPFNIHPAQPTPDTILVDGNDLDVKKFPGGRASDIDVVGEMEDFGDKGHGPYGDEDNPDLLPIMP